MGLSLRKLGSKIFDQVNPFDNGRTYQQRTPTNNRSVVQQAVNSGASNVAQGVARNAVRVAGQTPVGRVVAPVVAPISSPQDFIDNVSVPVERAVTKSPVGRGLQGVGLGALRVGAGYAQAAGGAYDLATPGLGKNRLSKSATALGKQTDDTLKEVGGNQAIYKGAQLGSELLLLKGAGSLGKVGIKGLSQIPKVASGASAVSKGVKVATSPVTKAINPATAKVSQGITKVGTKGLGGKITAKAATNIVSPKYQGVNAAFSGIQLSKEAAQGRAITPERIATDLAIGGVAFPVAGAVGSQALLPGAKIALKGVGKGAKVSAKATQDAIQAVRNPLKPLNEGGYIRLSDGKDITAKKIDSPDYAMSHRPAEGVPAHDLTAKVDGEQMIPSDMYDQWYGSRGTLADKESISALKAIKGKPDADVTIYRASPNEDLNHGDWVTLSKDYAQQHAEGQGGKVHAYKVKANELKWAMDDVNEFGFFPTKTAQPTKNKLGLKKLNETGAVGKDVTSAPMGRDGERGSYTVFRGEGDNRTYEDFATKSEAIKAHNDYIKKGEKGVRVDTYNGDGDLIDTFKEKPKIGLTKLNEGGYAKIPKTSQLPKVALKQETAPQAPVPENNLVDSLPNNNIADNTKVPLQVTNKDTLLGELKTAMVDKDAPILDYLKGVEKETGQTGLVKQFMYDTGLQRRSSSIANAMMDNSDNLSAAFRGLVGKEKKAFDGYVGARREIQYTKDGLQTSAPVEELQGVVSAGSRFDDRYNALNGYYKEWAGRLHQAGILDDATYKSFTDSGEYTRVQRVMDDLAGFRGSGGNSYSLGTTMTKQKRKGSQRDIQPADLTAMKYAQDSQTEIQRNQTSSNLIDVLASQGHARQVENTTSKNTLSRIVDGKTEIWEVPRDIKEVADNVSPYQLGILSRIIAFPQRLLRAGATGLSAPFTTANYAKDQVSSAAMSENVKVTHQPKNVFNGLYQAAKDFGVGTDDPTWQKFLENLGDTTQYDFLRNQKSAKQFSRELRLGQGGRAINKGLHPIRTVEDLVQITEKATRFQNFKGTYEKALADGVPEAEALQKATLAAWQNSVDFSRMGSVGQVINLLIPYFNAGIQGTRLLVRRTGEAPLATSSKIISFVGLPLAAATFYNMEDEGRKKVYDNISDFEKQNNIIIVLPGAEQHEDGSYSGVVKIPLQPGMSNTVQPLRMAIENYAHDNPQDVLAMSKQFLGAVAGPINTNSISSAVGGLIPQVAKPMVQQVANNDFFTQKQIVPDFIQKATDANGNPVKETDKAYPYTSGTARIIGNATGQSPIRVEKFIKDTSAKVGQYTMNATDNALAKAGIIPDEQIGGISVKEDFARRFAVAQGKENTKKSEGARHYDDVNKETATLNGNELAAFNALHPNKKNFLGDTITDMDSVYNSAARLDAYNRYPKVFEVDKRLDAKGRKAGNPGNPLYDLEQWQVKKVLEKENLPPGASDKELSKLHEQDWYNDYSTKKSKFFTDIKNKSASDLETAKAKGDTKKVKALEASITKFNSSDNPYPVTSPDLQKQMDYYSSLPKGTGARKSWIQSNPGLYKQMQDQYAKIDNWQNVQRGKRGLDTTEGVAGANAGYDTGSSSGGYSKGGSKGGGSGGGGSSSPEVESAYKYAIKLKSSGGIPKPKVKAVASKKVKASGKVGKIKVSSKKSLV